MRFDPPQRPGWRDLRAELRRGLVEGRLPVIGVPGAADGEISGWETSDDVLATVTVQYGGPDSWLSVETARWTGTIRSSPDLRETLKDYLRVAGVRFADVVWSESEAELTVDGRALTAKVMHAGEDWWAARVAFPAGAFGEIEVGLVAYRKGLESRLGALPDATVAAMLDAPQADPQRWSQAERSPEPEETAGEPHRVLVNVVLRTASRQLEWLDEGGPAPQLPASWGAMWSSAIRRQADLSGEPEPVAEESVQSLLSQLTRLQSDAAWFRENEALRERAINETLLFATGLAPDVPSRPAQEAWREREGARPQQPDAPVEIEAVVAAQEHWLSAWHDWTKLP
jgi:hypothetical protein